MIPRAFGRLTGASRRSPRSTRCAGRPWRTLESEREALETLETGVIRSPPRNVPPPTPVPSSTRPPGAQRGNRRTRRRRGTTRRDTWPNSNKPSPIARTVDAWETTPTGSPFPALPRRPRLARRRSRARPFRSRPRSAVSAPHSSEMASRLAAPGRDAGARRCMGARSRLRRRSAGFGTLVIVDHGAAAFTLYGHLARGVASSGGRTSAAATPLGTVGLAPAGGAALYFEVRVDGRPANPLQWLRSSP